jgi:ABC-2 type transport system ATP-binding protein
LFNDRTEHDGATVRVVSGRGAGTLVRLLHALDENSLTIENLSVREPTLDDVFLSLTGQRSRTEKTFPMMEGEL